MIGERLRAIRRERGMTQAELADLLGTHFTSVSQMERGLRGITVQQLIKLSTALGVTPNDVLLSGPPPNPVSRRKSRVLKRLQRLEELSDAEQKAILEILDGLLRRSPGKGKS